DREDRLQAQGLPLHAGGQLRGRDHLVAMRCLVLGGAGMLGQAVIARAGVRGWDAVGLSHEQADVTDRDRLLHWAGELRPEVIVNCAAFTQVDACETDPERAYLVNGAGVAYAAAAA